MDVAAERSARSFLRRSAAAYEALVADILRLETRGDDERTLRWLSLAAEIAWTAHPGRFADGRLEAVALRIGQRLQPAAAMAAAQAHDAASTNERRRVLHVATTVYGVGGHTRLIENWIKSDNSTLHSLVLLDQGEFGIPPGLAGLIADSGGELIALPASASLLGKAQRLRRIAQSGYDCLILHHHPNDVVPLVALAAAECPPVAVMNHADHVFWLGVSVADAVIEFRHYGARLSRDRRSARQMLMLPLPIELPSPPLDRAQARARLNIPDTEVMLLSIGQGYKYTPTKKHNFFHTLHQVLADNPTARLYVVGVSEEQFSSFGVPYNDRFELLGFISDPTAYEAAADIYLESFPYGSYTALIETIARGACPVLMYSPQSHTDISRDVSLNGLIESPADEADYVARVTALINDPEARAKLGQAAARQITSVHGCDVGRTYIQPIYERLAAMTHRAAPIPTQPGAETEDDLALVEPVSSRVTPILSRISDKAIAGLTVGELLRLFAISVRSGDTRFAPAHVRSWLSILKRKAFPPRPASDSWE
jgi:glycosyltransferase involved in cell wall biosynthesis